MHNFTQDEKQPNPSTILFLKQYARMCNLNKKINNGYNNFTLIACC